MRYPFFHLGVPTNGSPHFALVTAYLQYVAKASDDNFKRDAIKARQIIVFNLMCHSKYEYVLLIIRSWKLSDFIIYTHIKKNLSYSR